jgi:DNA-binding NarL/FixJ family response regulator
VAEQLVRGLANKEIARELQIAPETVKSHVRDIMQRLGARNRTEVVLQLVRPAR